MCIFEKGYIMTNLVNKVTAFLLAVALVFSLAIISHGAENTASVNDDSVFLTQQSRVTCTLVSSLMLFRRGAIINGNPNWETFTESKYRRTNWWPDGLSRKISAEGMTAICHNLSEYGLKKGDINARRTWFIDLLEQHPEGIMIYCNFSSNNAHAVLLTDYDAATDTFYCADPSPIIQRGRIPLGDSELPSHVKRAGYRQNGMSNQDYILSYVHRIWLIESGIDYSKTYKIPAEKIEGGLCESWIVNTPASSLLIRKGPSTVCADIGKLSNATTVTVFEKYNGWGHIKVGNTDGWISLEHALKAAPDKIISTIDSHDATAFGKIVKMAEAPIMANDRVMLPVRFIAEALGATVLWNESLEMITVTNGETVITMHIGSDTAFIEEREVILDCPPLQQNGTAYAPVRFIAEALGATVSYDAKTKQITITK